MSFIKKIIIIINTSEINSFQDGRPESERTVESEAGLTHTCKGSGRYTHGTTKNQKQNKHTKK